MIRGVGSRAGFGLRGPRRPIRGRDLAGRVEAVGGNVTQLRPGDDVYGVAHGTFAGSVCATEHELAPKPRGLTDVQAAAMPVAATTALRAIRDHGRVAPGTNEEADRDPGLHRGRAQPRHQGHERKAPNGWADSEPRLVAQSPGPVAPAVRT